MRSVVVMVAVLFVVACGKSEKAGGGDKPADKPAATAPADKPAEPVAPAAPAPTAGEPQAIKACDLISEADASAALGNPTKYRSNDGGENCVLDPSAEPPQGDTIDYSAKSDPTFYDFLVGGPMKAGRAVEGVGDKAMIEGSEDGQMQFAILKGGKTVHGSAMQLGAKRPGFEGRIKALMTKIAEKL